MKKITGLYSEDIQSKKNSSDYWFFIIIFQFLPSIKSSTKSQRTTTFFMKALHAKSAVSMQIKVDRWVDLFAQRKDTGQQFLVLKNYLCQRKISMLYTHLQQQPKDSSRREERKTWFFFTLAIFFWNAIRHAIAIILAFLLLHFFSYQTMWL